MKVNDCRKSTWNKERKKQCKNKKTNTKCDFEYFVKQQKKGTCKQKIV